MAKQKLTDQEFKEKILDLVLEGWQTAPIVAEMMAITGLSKSGVYTRMYKLGFEIEKRLVMKKAS